jgi:hypothetical protein
VLPGSPEPSGARGGRPVPGKNAMPLVSERKGIFARRVAIQDSATAHVAQSHQQDRHEFAITAWYLCRIEKGLAIPPSNLYPVRGRTRPAPVNCPSQLPDRILSTPGPGERKEAP